MSRRLTRRRYLAGIDATAAVGLAGCSGDGDGRGTPTSTGSSGQSEAGPVWRMMSVDAANTGTVYFGSSYTGIYAVSASDGNQQWHVDTKNSIESSPAVVDGTVYVGGAGDNMYALTEQ